MSISVLIQSTKFIRPIKIKEHEQMKNICSVIFTSQVSNSVKNLFQIFCHHFILFDEMFFRIFLHLIIELLASLLLTF
jgi:hypothetical protein